MQQLSVLSHKPSLQLSQPHLPSHEFYKPPIGHSTRLHRAQYPFSKSTSLLLQPDQPSPTYPPYMYNVLAPVSPRTSPSSSQKFPSPSLQNHHDYTQSKQR
ncbi:pentatricopeptide repeat-containing protein, mitochondrial [Trifolium repens]|nr:pentatricopeptide repeat-containing protein, mitochondrial [Trifolium repens]